MRPIILAFLLIGALTSSLPAQQKEQLSSDAVDAILTAAISAALKNYPSGEMALDPRVLVRSEVRSGPGVSADGLWNGDHPKTFLTKASALPAHPLRIQKREELQKLCTTLCKYADVQGTVATSSPQVNSDFSVDVLVRAELNYDRPIGGIGGTFELYTLRSEKGVWRIVQRRLLSAN